MYMRINLFVVHEPVAPIKISVVCYYKSDDRKNKVAGRMLIYIGINFCVAVLLKSKNSQAEKTENEH